MLYIQEIKCTFVACNDDWCSCILGARMSVDNLYVILQLADELRGEYSHNGVHMTACLLYFRGV